MLKEWLTDSEFELIRITLIDLPEGSFIDDEEFIKISGFDKSLQRHLVNKWPNISPGSGEAIAIIQCLKQIASYCEEMEDNLDNKINCDVDEFDRLIDKLFAFEQQMSEQLVEKLLTLSSKQTPMQFGKQDRIYPKLSSKLKHELSHIRPIKDEGMVYYPCDVKLDNGDVKRNVILVEAGAYLNFWGSAPYDEWEVLIEDVVSIMEASNRLPEQVEDKLTKIHETRMGGVDFRLILKDGSEVSVCTGNYKYYLDLKNKFTINDIVDVRSVAREEIEMDPQVTIAKYYYCLFT